MTCVRLKSFRTSDEYDGKACQKRLLFARLLWLERKRGSIILRAREAGVPTLIFTVVISQKLHYANAFLKLNGIFVHQFHLQNT
ncbi:hypothetical protein [Endozoicomonas sp. ONNA2]|uniref:hypothetical protein n=1 Tax=Endozoicomonas sp. ONNA2 TaxID=2828741 RepID=UPI00214796C4|nr:hypothetical protein [Endozoicomonas sp. ONNA2]